MRCKRKYIKGNFDLKNQKFNAQCELCKSNFSGVRSCKGIARRFCSKKCQYTYVAPIAAKSLKENKLKDSYHSIPVGFPEGIEYQKPFYEVEEGYGYEGVILVNKTWKTIQCHICGKWKHHLGTHIRIHNISAKDYKIKFKLNRNTALVSEKIREKMVRNGQNYPWERTHSIKARAKQKARMRALGKLSKGNQHHSMEYKNKKGTCTLQLIEQVEEVAKKLGRIPYGKEMRGYKGQNIETTVRKNIEMKNMHNILKRKGYQYIDCKRKYTEEELLNGIRKFANTYKRKPSFSDLQRGLLPGSHRPYYKHFGSWANAKKLAFITEE